MENPLVSIIVPIYNSAKDMVPCLESIKNQKYQNLEVLLVNDGSNDASLEICRMYARLDSRIIIIDKENSGVSGTRNVAHRARHGAVSAIR
ncbi:MAG: glycosyltransferase [Christensenellales bacterium]